MNAQEHYLCAESHYQRAKVRKHRQAYDFEARELQAANYHATMSVAAAQIAMLEAQR